MQQSISLIGYACGIAAGDTGCGDGPPLLQQRNLSRQLATQDIAAVWQAMLYPEIHTNKYSSIADICRRLAQLTRTFSVKKQSFAVLGGDHSCAIGTWSGVAAALRKQGTIGLIWIDAHLDSHTPQTSESGNIHGMPVAALLGYGDDALIQIGDAQPKIKPEHLCIIGARSFEAGEQALLERLKVRVFYMDEIRQRGLPAVFAEAHQRVNQHTTGYGVSIDLDGIDPAQAPAVGTAEPNGLDSQALLRLLKQYCAQDSRLLGCEITEFNPHRDQQCKTELLISQLLTAIF